MLGVKMGSTLPELVRAYHREAAVFITSTSILSEDAAIQSSQGSWG